MTDDTYDENLLTDENFDDDLAELLRRGIKPIGPGGIPPWLREDYDPETDQLREPDPNIPRPGCGAPGNSQE